MFSQNIESIQFYFQTNVQMFIFSMVYSATSFPKVYKRGYQFISLGSQSYCHHSTMRQMLNTLVKVLRTQFWGLIVYFYHKIFHITLLWWSRRKTTFFPPMQLSTDNGPSASKLNIEGCSLC